MKNLNLSLFILAAAIITINCEIVEIDGDEDFVKDIKELLFLGDTPAPTPSPIRGVAGEIFAVLKSAFGFITTDWPKIVETFKISKTSTIKETLLGKGFSYFAQSAQIQISKGLEEANFDKFMGYIAKRLKVPEERRDDLTDVVETAKFVEKQAWVAFNTLYSVDKIGNTKFATLLIGKDEQTGKYDIVLSDVQADFQFAPDLIVVNKKLSVFGGIFNHEKDETISRPRSITQEDIQTVLNFFEIIAYQTIAKYMKIDLPLPK